MRQALSDLQHGQAKAAALALARCSTLQRLECLETLPPESAAALVRLFFADPTVLKDQKSGISWTALTNLVAYHPSAKVTFQEHASLTGLIEDANLALDDVLAGSDALDLLHGRLTALLLVTTTHKKERSSAHTVWAFQFQSTQTDVSGRLIVPKAAGLPLLGQQLETYLNDRIDAQSLALGLQIAVQLGNVFQSDKLDLQEQAFKLLASLDKEGSLSMLGSLACRPLQPGWLTKLHNRCSLVALHQASCTAVSSAAGNLGQRDG